MGSPAESTAGSVDEKPGLDRAKTEKLPAFISIGRRIPHSAIGIKAKGHAYYTGWSLEVMSPSEVELGGHWAIFSYSGNG